MPMIGTDFGFDEISEAVSRRGLLSLEIEPSHLCNYRCGYCYLEDLTASPDDLTPEEIRTVIGDGQALGAKKIILLGGEPMLTPNLKELIEFISGRGLETEIFTNGSRIDPPMAEFLMRHKVRVVVKLNSLDEDLQDKLAGKTGAGKISMAALHNLLGAGYPGEGGLIGASTVICRDNLGELEPLWCWLRERDITPYFEMLTPQGKASTNESLAVDTGDIQKLFETIAARDKAQYGRDWEPQPPLLGSHCLRHLYSCVVTANGDVFSCVGVPLPVGNIRDTPLADILSKSDVIDDLRHFKETIQGPCSACEKASECYGCRGAAYNLTGNYLASDPTCWLNCTDECEKNALPLDTAGIMEHAGPMRLLDTLTEVSECSAVSETRIRPGNPFLLSDGILDETSYPELIAQTLAAFEGFRRARKGIERGLLTGIRNMEVFASARVGDQLRIEVRKQATYMGIGVVEGEVYRGDELLAQGEIRLWRNLEDAETEDQLTH